MPRSNPQTFSTANSSPLFKGEASRPVQEIKDLVDLRATVFRGLTPSSTPGTRVQLTLIPQRGLELERLERLIGRNSQTCGCTSAGVAFVVTMLTLTLLHISFGAEIALFNFPEV